MNRVIAHLLALTCLSLGLTTASATHECADAPPSDFVTSPDYAETPLPAEPVDLGRALAAGGGGTSGALSGRVVYMSGGHGWNWNGTSWGLDRPVLLNMNEDYGNVDQMTHFAYYCFNAGATVVPMRPVGNQTNEVVLDNDSAGVVFSGTWGDSSSTIYFGDPGDLPYRFTSVASSETATATYTPTIPQAGLYPVYTWVRHGSDRTNQLYRINHTGGQSLVRVPHHLVGNGWVYLGSYYFNAGSNSANGAVIISNLGELPLTGARVVIADAIRFGNGMGDIDRGGGISTYPREEEASRYWIQRAVSQGQAASIYDGSGDDGSDNVGAPIRMAREMNRSETGNQFERVYVSFHSNAGSGANRGVLGLYNNTNLFPGTATPNQPTLAWHLAKEVNDDLVAIGSPPLEVPWSNRTTSNNLIFARSDFAFGEINNGSILNEFDATIVEVAFHDNTNDTYLLRDPKVRNWIARSTYHGLLRYFNGFDGAPLTFVPEPPGNPRALSVTNGIQVSWNIPVSQGGSGSPTGYLVYVSTNGYGFGNPTAVSAPITNFTFSNLLTGVDYYFRVSATNAGGESMPSEVVGCRRAAEPATARGLVVNAFDRFDRSLNLRQTPAAENYKPPGHDNNTGSMDRVLPARVNSFDYVVPHGRALSANGWAFDSCQNEAVAGGLIALSNYPVVIWACGNESTADESFSAAEQLVVSNHLAAGRALFVSGSEIAWDLDRNSGPTAADRTFLNSVLRARLNGNTNDDSGSYTVTPAVGGIFVGRANGLFDDGSRGIYWVGYPDVLVTNAGSRVAMNYSGVGWGAAAVQYDGTQGGGRSVYLGFPFETLTDATRRTEYLGDILNFLYAPPPAIVTPPQSLTLNQGALAAFTVAASGPGLTYQWRFGTNALPGATNQTYQRLAAQLADAGPYAVVVTNLSGSVTSAPANLTVVPFEFTATTFLPGNLLSVGLSAVPGDYVIESSTNLLTWAAWTNVTLVTNPGQWNLPVAPESQRYFRARP
jgi:hypothetical protein